MININRWKSSFGYPLKLVDRKTCYFRIHLPYAMKTIWEKYFINLLVFKSIPGVGPIELNLDTGVGPIELNLDTVADITINKNMTNA